ncbi:MAG: arylesterase [Pseudomonadota bacterium]
MFDVNFTQWWALGFCKPLLAVAVAAFTAGLTITAHGQTASTTSDNSDAPQIVVLGDSLVAGYQLAAEEAFPVRLQKALDARGVSALIIGAGVSGDTTSGGLARLNWSVPEDADGVLLELGANDALRGLPPETTRANLDAMISQLKARNVDVLLTGMMAPPNLGEDYAKMFNPIYADLAEKHELLLYPFFLEGVAANPKLNLEDGIHPTAEGIDIIVARMLPLVEQFVETLRPIP